MERILISYFLFKNVDFLFKNVDFLFKNVDFITKKDGKPVVMLITRWVKMMSFVLKMRNFVFTTRDLNITNEDSCIKNDEFCSVGITVTTPWPPGDTISRLRPPIAFGFNRIIEFETEGANTLVLRLTGTDGLEVRFSMEQSCFPFKNPDFLIKNPDFLLKNVLTRSQTQAQNFESAIPGKCQDIVGIIGQQFAKKGKIHHFQFNIQRDSSIFMQNTSFLIQYPAFLIQNSSLRRASENGPTEQAAPAAAGGV